MKRTIIETTIYMLLAVMLPAAIYAEAVFLKDGSIIEGRIVKERGGTMEVRTTGNMIRKLKRSEVLRIVYEEQYRQPCKIMLMNGTLVDGYIVDEDRDRYYVRSKLTSPDEKAIDKKEVQFIERVRIERRRPASRRVYAMPLISMPLSENFKHYNDTGFGILALYSLDDIITNDFSVAAVSGYIHYPGKNGVEFSLNIPILASFKYSFKLYRHFTVAPVLVPGLCLDYIAYTTAANSTYLTGGSFLIGGANAMSRWGIEPLVMAGLESAWSYSEDITVTAGAYCSAIIEKEKALYSIIYSAGCGIKF